jgi:glutamate-1-semialdehyde 2,1-aminomutase
MEMLAPLGPVYQAGTLSGNPLAMAAGMKTLEMLLVPGFYESLSAKTSRMLHGVLDAAKARGIPMTSNQVGGMFGLFFTEAERVENFADATACNLDRFKLFFHGMLERGVYLAPSAYEAGFVSAAHSDADIDATIAAAAEVFDTL